MNETYIPGFSYALRGAPVRRLAVGGRAGRGYREDVDFNAYGADQYYQPAPQPVQAVPSDVQVAAAPTAAEEVDPYTGLTTAQRDAQIAALEKSITDGTFEIGDLGIVPEWEQFKAPSYSAPVTEYLSALDKYIIENDPTFGMMYSKAPTVDLSTPEKIRQYSLYGIGDFLPEEQVAAYMDKPFEQNVGFTVAPTEAGVGKNVTGALDVGYNTPIILRDDATGEIVYQGTGFAGAQEAARLSNQLSATGDKKTQWSLMTGDPGATDISQFKTVAQDKPDYLGGVLGALVQYGLPIGLSLIPGVGWAGSAALAGAGSTAGKLISGYDLDDALKAGLITAGTAGLLKAPILSGGSSIGGAIGDVVGKIPGVGDALEAVTPSGSYVDAAGDIVVRGALSSPLIEGAASSLIGSSAFTPNYSGMPTYELPDYGALETTTEQVSQEQEVPQQLPTFDEAFAPGWDVVANTGGTALPAVGGAVAGGALDTILNNSLVNTPINEVPQQPQQPQQPDQTADNDIVVRGDTGGTALPAVGGAVAGGALDTILNNSLVNTPIEEVPQQPQQPDQTADNDIVVRGDTSGTALPAVGGAVAGGALDTILNNSLVNTPIEEVPQQPQQPDQTVDDGIVVRGDTGGALDLPVVPPVVPPVSGYDPATNTITAVAEPSKPITDAETKIDAVVPPITSVDIPANAGDVTPKDSKGLSVADYIRLASLGISTIGKLFEGSGTPSGSRYFGGTGALNPIFSAQLPGANMPGLTAGTSGARPVTQSGLNTTQDWYRYGYGPEQSFFNYVPMAQPNTSQAYTGYAQGGFAVEGPGDGRDDKIPAMLSDGEYVIDAETVALLGNGSNKAGADLLDKFRVNVRKHKGQQLAKGEFSNDAKRPEHYMAGGRM